jgi:hypothetical protein
MVVKTRGGLPMSEESLAEWQKAFSDIEESIELVYKNGVNI